jgi:hypothetical protein
MSKNAIVYEVRFHLVPGGWATKEFEGPVDMNGFKKEIVELCHEGVWVKDSFYPPVQILKASIQPPRKKVTVISEAPVEPE